MTDTPYICCAALVWPYLRNKSPANGGAIVSLSLIPPTSDNISLRKASFSVDVAKRIGFLELSEYYNQIHEDALSQCTNMSRVTWNGNQMTIFKYALPCMNKDGIRLHNKSIGAVKWNEDSIPKSVKYIRLNEKLMI